MHQFNDEEYQIIKKVLTSDVVKLAMGAEEWDLTEVEEIKLWEVINAMEKDG